MTQLGIIAQLDKLNIQACYAVGPIAQSVEQRTFNPWVDGSSPSGPTHLSKTIAKSLRNPQILPPNPYPLLEPFEVSCSTLHSFAWFYAHLSEPRPSAKALPLISFIYPSKEILRLAIYAGL